MTGYAFVEFEEERDAEDAVYELNGKSVNGESVNVDYATVPRMTGRGRSPGYSSRRRYDDDYDRGSRYGGRRQGGGGRDRDGRDRHDKYDDRNRRPAGSQGYYGPLNKSPYRLIIKNLSVAGEFNTILSSVIFCKGVLTNGRSIKGYTFFNENQVYKNIRIQIIKNFRTF